jgi:hypothetical protein
MKKAFFSLLMALLISALKNITVPKQYNFKFGLEGRQQTVNNLIYFTGIDLILVCLMACIICLCGFFIEVLKHRLPASKAGEQYAYSIESFQIFAYAALWLAIGKFIDEFISPYGYHAFELVYDLFIATCMLISLFRHKSHLEQ